MNQLISVEGEEMRKHLESAIKMAAIKVDPWPHLYVENIFPPNMYNMIVAAWPDKSVMKQFSKYPNRFIYWLVEKGGNRPPVLPFWADLRDCLFDTLWNVLEEKLEVEGSSIGAELLNDFSGYSIRPHTDTTDKLITGLFYMPKTDNHAQEGTVLYRGKAPDPSGKGASVEAEAVVTMPYMRNSALFFVRTDWSYHGVRPTPVERRLLAFDVFK